MDESFESGEIRVGIAALLVGLGLGYLVANYFAPERSSEDNGIEDEDSDEDQSDSSDFEEDEAEPHKMVFCIRQDLKMQRAAARKYKKELSFWRKHGQAKITLKIDSEEQMLALKEAADAAGLNTHIVMDAGRTQIAAGSRTVLALGPAPVSLVNKVTGSLKLY